MPHVGTYCVYEVNLISLKIGIQLARCVWFAILSRRYPHLEIIERLTVRSAMDTYRCQGVLTILLQIQGQCDVEDVKRKILVSILNSEQVNKLADCAYSVN